LFAGLDDPAIEVAVAEVQAQAEAFAGYRAQLAPGMATADFVAIVDAYEALVNRATRLQGYGMLRYAGDTQDQVVQAFMARMQQMLAQLDNQTMFFKLWWKALEDAPAGRLLNAAGEYRYWLESLRLERPHTLSEAEEKIINLKDVNGVRALNTLYSSITNRYTFKMTIDGEEKELTRGELQVYFRDGNPDLRAAAYQELYRVYAQDVPVLGQIYQFLARDWHSENVDLRHYASPIAVRNLANDIPDAVVETLLDVSRANAPLFQRYFRLKARWLGVERLRRYDVYAPVVQTDKQYDYHEAVQLVLDSFREFDSGVASMAQRVFDEHHLDGEVRKGKMSGAFCATILPKLTPWVLQSYQQRPDDVATMAHELGHAVHSMLAAHHNSLVQRPSLPLAETASTFGEMLLVDRILATDPDPGLQRDLLFRQMDDAYATILRQAYFALFERTAHARVAQGASVDDLSAYYLETLQEQFGDSLDLSDDFRHEWVAIPHIYSTPFYVYAYAFGQLLVLALYQQYRREGAAFKPRYLEILAAGGSDAPAQVLARAGIDISSADFWQGGFDVIADMLAQLEEIPVA
jgi:oligoendopeptidase F